MTPTLRQLQYVVTLARLGHFGRAAASCHVSQPALSQQIRQFEEACGTPLFERDGKGVRPTPFGEAVVERARRILEEAEALETFIETRSGRPTRPLRFGLIPTVAPYLLPDMFPLLKSSFPDLGFTVSESRTETLLEGLGEGSLDLALIASEPPPGSPRLVTEPLFEDHFLLATGKGEAPPAPVPLGAIDRERLLLLDEGHCLRDQAIAACNLDPGAAARTFAATSLSTIVEFVANGQGVTLLPAIALRKEASARIEVHPLAAPGAGRLLTLCWRDGSPYAALFVEIAEAIRQTRPA